MIKAETMGLWVFVTRFRGVNYIDEVKEDPIPARQALFEVHECDTIERVYLVDGLTNLTNGRDVTADFGRLAYEALIDIDPAKWDDHLVDLAAKYGFDREVQWYKMDYYGEVLP